MVDVTSEDREAAIQAMNAIERQRSFGGNGTALRQVAEAFARHRLSTRPALDGEPVAWMYSNADDLTPSVSSEQWREPEAQGWTETPLFAHPPRNDAVVEALRDALAWHEDQDNAISKQPNANMGDNGWRRLQHQEQAELLRSALKQGEPR